MPVWKRCLGLWEMEEVLTGLRDQGRKRKCKPGQLGADLSCMLISPCFCR